MYQWNTIDDNAGVPGPPMNDRYRRIHGFKPMVSELFDTILQCVFNFTAINHGLFQIISLESNKYT